MIINVRYVLLLAFRGLPLSLKLNLNSKTLSMSYCNSSIFCSAVLQYRACRTCMGGKSDGQFSSTFLSDCQHGFLLSGLFFQMPSLQITNLTHVHTHMLDQAAPTGHHTGNMSPKMWRFCQKFTAQILCFSCQFSDHRVDSRVRRHECTCEGGL